MKRRMLNRFVVGFFLLVRAHNTESGCEQIGEKNEWEKGAMVHIEKRTQRGDGQFKQAQNAV